MNKKIAILVILCSELCCALQAPQITIAGITLNDSGGNTILRYVETTPTGITEADYVESGPLLGRYSASIRSIDITDEGTFARNQEFFGDEAHEIFDDLQSRYSQEKG